MPLPVVVVNGNRYYQPFLLNLPAFSRNPMRRPAVKVKQTGKKKLRLILGGCLWAKRKIGLWGDTLPKNLSTLPQIPPQLGGGHRRRAAKIYAPRDAGRRLGLADSGRRARLVLTITKSELLLFKKLSKPLCRKMPSTHIIHA